MKKLDVKNNKQKERAKNQLQHNVPITNNKGLKNYILHHFVELFCLVFYKGLDNVIGKFSYKVQVSYSVRVVRAKNPAWRTMIVGWTVPTRKQTIIYNFYDSALLHQYTCTSFMFSFLKSDPPEWKISQSKQHLRNFRFALLIKR